MNTSLLLVVVVVVVVSASTYTSAHYSSHSGPGVKRWPFYIAPSSDQPSGHQPSDQQPSGHQPYGHQPSGHQPCGHQPSGHQPCDHQPSGHQPYGHQPRTHWRNHQQVSVPGRPLVTQGNRNYPYGPSYGVSSIDAFNHRVTDVRKRCRNDLLLLRRLLEQGKHTYGIRKPHFPRFPSYGIPRYIPNLGDSSEEEQRSNSDEGSYEFDLDDYFYDFDEDSGEDTDDRTTFLDFPVQKPGWSIHPFFPKVPTADDFPDDYDNATHTVHVLNGTRVEVNTTTNKDTDDSITTFFHTKVINIGPHTPTKGKVPEKEDAPERTPTPDEGLAGEPVVPVYEVEETTTKQIPVVEETIPEIPVYDHNVLSELVLEEEPGSDTRVVRDSPSRSGKQPSASYVKKYVKGASKGGSKGGKARPKPRDLSRDTLVNHINKDSEEDKPTEPDAEVIF